MHGQVSSLYVRLRLLHLSSHGVGLQCDESVVGQSPWLQALHVVGVLNVSDNFNVGNDHPLFAVTVRFSHVLPFVSEKNLAW
jgi:hypothetical protein